MAVSVPLRGSRALGLTMRCSERRRAVPVAINAHCGRRLPRLRDWVVRLRIYAMPIYGSYIRAFGANLPIFAVFVLWLLQRQTEPTFPGFFAAIVLGFVPSLIVSLFVGVFLQNRN